MRKLWYPILCIGAFVCFLPTYADDCSDALSEAKKNYNTKSYSKAKELFEYVQSECGETYGSADQWIKKCDNALKPSAPNPQTTLSASQSQVNIDSEGTNGVFVSISSNKSWNIVGDLEYWCQVTRTSSGITIKVPANPNTYSRNTSVQIKTVDEQKSLTIYVIQGAHERVSTSDSSTPELSLSRTSISVSSSESTEYITVTCDREWEIEYPSATMYTATRISSTLVKVVINRNTSSSRQDFFNVKTIDGSKKIRVDLSQSSGSGTYYSTGNRTSSYSGLSSYGGYTALRNFNSEHGKWEVDWMGIRTSICTGIDFEMSFFGIRYSVLKIEPGIIGIRYDFIKDYAGFYYQPDVKLVFPWSKNAAFEFGIGPSFNVNLRSDESSGNYLGSHYYHSSSRNTYPSVWFTAELGILYHWGDICSSDFFIRYDGMFSIGTSINICTGF